MKSAGGVYPVSPPALRSLSLPAHQMRTEAAEPDHVSSLDAGCSRPGFSKPYGLNQQLMEWRSLFVGVVFFLMDCFRIPARATI